MQVLAYITWKLKKLDEAELTKKQNDAPIQSAHQSPPLDGAKPISPPVQQQRPVKTPLHYACEAGSTHAASYLLTHLKAHIIEQDHNGYTPLHYAVIKDHVAVVELLLFHERARALQQRRLLTIKDKANKTPGEYANNDQMKKLFGAGAEKKESSFTESLGSFADDLGSFVKDIKFPS